MDKIVELIQQDTVRLQAIYSVAQLGLPQCYLAAGFVRNLVWDYLHNKSVPTPLNDVDVIYFDPEETDIDAYRQYESRLIKEMSELNWQVRNQAKMHLRNGDKPYTSTIDAMSYWPEKETAVGIRKQPHGEFECVSPFGFDSLFHCHVTCNPKCRREIFEKRAYEKGWLEHWPSLKIMS